MFLLMNYLLFHNVKSDILAELETIIEVYDKILNTEKTLSTATVIDATMAVDHTVRSGGAKTFGQLAKKYYKSLSSSLGVNGCNRIDIVFVCYDKPESIKAGERARRVIYFLFCKFLFVAYFLL